MIIATTQIISQHLSRDYFQSDFSVFAVLCFQPCIHLVESHSCWCYNSQEIATLISHLLRKDFPRMKYFLLADIRQRFFIIFLFSSFSSRWPWLVILSALRRGEVRNISQLSSNTQFCLAAGTPDRGRRRMSPYKALSSREPSGWATVWGSYRGWGRSSSVGQLRPPRLSGRNGNWETRGGQAGCQPRWVSVWVFLCWVWSSPYFSGRWGKTEELSKEFLSLKTLNLNPLCFSKYYTQHTTWF